MKYFGIFLMFFFAIQLLAQKQDYNWVIGTGGYDQIPSEPFGNFIMSFENESMIMTRIISEAKMYGSNGILCGPNGNILIYSNACRVFGENHKLMPGLEEINLDSYWWRGDGHPIGQAVLFLEDPGNVNQAYILYCFDDKPIASETVLQSNMLRASLVNLENLDQPRVIFKDKNIYPEKYAAGEITATRHANGRDWWIIIPKRFSTELIIFLLDPSGIRFYNMQSFMLPSTSGGLGQACFSPNGSMYALGNIDGNYRLGGYVELFDFDRCEGTLSNKRIMPVSDSTNFGGLAFSPNNQFLYFATQTVLYRTLASAQNPESERIKIDTFRGNKKDPFRCSFEKMQLGPDGRIYMVSAGSNRCMSLIHFPDKVQIEEIGWSQNGILLPTYNFKSIPNLPNFRLAAIDGTSCDTLGIDNFPLARFRYTQDSSQFLKFEFTNLSSFEPIESHWDFGDGDVSTDWDPMHHFSKAGLYTVCLMVRNKYGEDVQCKELNIGVSGTKNETNYINKKMDVWYQPLQSKLIIQIHDYYPRHMNIELYDFYGKRVHSHRIFSGINNINLEMYSCGVYYYKLVDNNKVFKIGKLLIFE